MERAALELPLGDIPFAPEHAPVVLTTSARRVPQWQREQNSAGTLPLSPVHAGTPLETIELIPYGNTNLRIGEFPVVK